MSRIGIVLRGAAVALCLAGASLISRPECVAADVDTLATHSVATTRHYLIGVYAGPTDNSTPALMGYRWDYTIGRSYQDNCRGCGVSGLTHLHGYPVVVDIQHVQTSYPNFQAAADGRYDTYYRQTAAALAAFGNQIYAIRIDSEFNGTWAATTPFKGFSTISTSTWITGFRRLALIVRQALPRAKIIWNPGDWPV